MEPRSDPSTEHFCCPLWNFFPGHLCKVLSSPQLPDTLCAGERFLEAHKQQPRLPAWPRRGKIKMLRVGTRAEPSASFQGVIRRQDPGRKASPMAVPDSDPGGGTVSWWQQWLWKSYCSPAGTCLLAAATQCSAPGRALRWGQERSWLTFGQVQATPALATQGKACAFACGWVGAPLSVNTCAMLRPLPVDATTLELSPRQPLLYLPSCRGEPAAGWGHDICWGTSSNSASPRFYLEKAIGIRCEAAVEQTQNKITRSASTPGTEGLFLLCWTTSSMSKCFSVPGGGGPWCGGFCTSPRTGVTVGLT